MKESGLKLTLLVPFLLAICCHGQEKYPKVVLITLDGYRWQELFTGADLNLVANSLYVKDTSGLKQRFWRETSEERRKLLMPFIWTVVPDIGQIHGNRNLGSKVDLINKHWFSYPGYNEILTGNADDVRIKSNDKFANPNTTLLEIANKDSMYRDKVAAFGSWDVFPFIVNEERSGVPVNAGFELAYGKDLSEREKFLNEIQPRVPVLWNSVRLDAFTHYYAMEYMKRKHPDLIYISYGETDDFAHDADYESYLNSAHNTDQLIRELYKFTQEDPHYKKGTIFLITTDHGRGSEPIDTWTGHGKDVNGAGCVWMIIFGNGVARRGEVSETEQLTSDQIAPTLLKSIGLDKAAAILPGKPIEFAE